MKEIKSSIFESSGPFLVGLISTLEGIRIIIRSDQQSAYQALGPGGYILLVGLGLMIFSLGYGYRMLVRKVRTIAKKTDINHGLTREMQKIIFATVVYIILIDIIGFAWATGCFFLMIFRILGLPWLNNVILTLVFSIPLYVIFAHWLSIPFPRGIFDPYF